MNFEIESVAAPRFAAESGSAVNCLVKFAHLPEAVQFTARHDDLESHGRALHAALIGGAHGVIGDYVAPVRTEAEKLRLEYARRGVTADKIALALLDNDAAQLQALRDAAAVAKAEAAK